MNETPLPVQRVLMTGDAIGGVWTYCLELAKALGELGIETILATMGPSPNPVQRRQAQTVLSMRLEEGNFRLEWMEDPWPDIQRAGEWLLGLEDKFKPDVVHLNGYAHAALPWKNPVIVVAHSCVLSWWEAVYSEAAPCAWDRYRHEVRRGLTSADLVVAPTWTMCSAIDRIYGPLPAGMVISNGRESKLFEPGKKQPIVLTAGRLWDAAKNVRLLEPVAARLRWPVYVAGDNQHPSGSTIEIQHVHLLGRLSTQDLADWLARASIFVLPARYEPFGLSVLEAALSGCALVLGDIPSLRETWDGAAWFISPNSEGELERCLNTLIENSGARMDLSAGAQRRASELTPERMAAGYSQAYIRVMQSRAIRNSSAGVTEQVTVAPLA
jgi:glycogen(starch) synthase